MKGKEKIQKWKDLFSFLNKYLVNPWIHIYLNIGSWVYIFILIYIDLII